jgi:shikimate kinase
MVRDDVPNTPPDDPDGLLAAVVEAWRGSGYILPVEQVYWTIRSRVPSRQGLKSSAAVAVAALRALADATEQEIAITDLIDMAGTAQSAAGVSITGSKDDAWAAATEGWKVIDPNVPAAEGVLLEGSGLVADDWTVILLLRGKRSKRPDAEAFLWHQQGFQRALSALENGEELVAMTANGRSMAGVLDDLAGRRLSNEAMMFGARAAGISGSGPAIAVFIPSVSTPTIERLQDLYEKDDAIEKVIFTKVKNPIIEKIEETS